MHDQGPPTEHAALSADQQSPGKHNISTVVLPNSQTAPGHIAPVDLLPYTRRSAGPATAQ